MSIKPACVSCSAELDPKDTSICEACDLAEAVEFAECESEAITERTPFLDLRMLVERYDLPVIEIHRPRSLMQDNAYRKAGK